MSKNDLHFLINEAIATMAGSADSLHDLEHTQRVVAYVKIFAQKNKLTENENEALVLAAWWHDASRTLTKKTSLLLMSFFDDILSAGMLLIFAMKNGGVKKDIWKAAKLIICKSLGSGTFFSRILIKTETEKKMLNMLIDADLLDIFRVERIQKIVDLIELSSRYEMSYKILVAFCIARKKIHLKTKEAIAFLEQLIKKIIAWAEEPGVNEWHIEKFGNRWVKKMQENLYKLLDEVTLKKLSLASI